MAKASSQQAENVTAPTSSEVGTASCADMASLTIPQGQMESKLIRDFSLLTGKIGILGGTFDPPHKGHLACINKVADELNLDRVIFMPTAHNPFKEKGPAATNQERLEMLLLLCKEDPRILVSDIEMARGGVSYTVDTLHEIRKTLPDSAELFLIYGADVVNSLAKFRNVAELPNLATIVPVGRSGYDLSAESIALLTPQLVKSIRENFIELDVPGSSSEVRADFESHGDSDLLTPAVKDYINAKNAYRI